MRKNFYSLLRLFSTKKVDSTEGMILFEATKFRETDQNSLFIVSENESVNFKLEPNEIEARIYNVIHLFKNIDIKSFSLKKSFKDLNIDSLETIALITAVEREFHIVFEETVFDNFENLNDVKTYISKSKYAF